MPGLNLITAQVAKVVTGGRNLAAFATSTGSTATGIVAFATIVIAVGVTPFGRGYLRDFMPEAMRGLPGVEAVVGVSPPRFSENLLGFRAPLDVAVSPNGQFVYVVEGGDDRDVKRLDMRDGSRTSLAPPRTTPGLRKPLAVATAPNGLVYVVDRLRYVVDIYDRENRWLGALPTPPSVSSWEPLAVTVDSTGNVFVTNASASGPNLVSYLPDGTMDVVFPRIAPGGAPLSFPGGIAVMQPGSGPRLMVLSDSNNRRMIAMGDSGEPLWTFGDVPGPSAIGLPRGIVRVNADRCLVVDATDHSITGWDLSGSKAKFLFRIGGPGVEDGEFLFPNGIAQAADGRLFITDRDNDRVQIWR